MMAPTRSLRSGKDSADSGDTSATTSGADTSTTATAGPSNAVMTTVTNILASVAAGADSAAAPLAITLDIQTLRELLAQPPPPATNQRKDHSSLKAITITQSDCSKVKTTLEQSSNNWHIWCHDILRLINLSKANGYIKGTVPRPDERIHPDDATMWDDNNLCIVAAIASCADAKEQEFLRDYTDAHLAWEALRERHEMIGPISQILLIQCLHAVRYRKNERFSKTSHQIHELARRIYSMGMPDEDTFVLIYMMNALSEELPHVRDHIADYISRSSAQDPYTPTLAMACLDTEQQLVENAHAVSQPLTLVAQQKPTHKDNCNPKECDSKDRDVKDPNSGDKATDGK